jgi:hypothetical protein
MTQVREITDQRRISRSNGHLCVVLIGSPAEIVAEVLGRQIEPRDRLMGNIMPRALNDSTPIPVAFAVPPPAASEPEILSPAIVKHLEFLDRVTKGESPPITIETAELARSAWQLIWQESGYRMPVPAACTGPDGEMFYSWDRGRHHLELEIIPGQPAEFFYRDRETGEFWGEEYTIHDPLPSKILARLTLFM